MGCRLGLSGERSVNVGSVSDESITFADSNLWGELIQVFTLNMTIPGAKSELWKIDVEHFFYGI